MTTGWEWIKRQPITPVADAKTVPMGSARQVYRELVTNLRLRLDLLNIANALGLDGDATAAQVVERIESLQYELDRHRGLHVGFTGNRKGQRDPLSVAAIHTALTDSMDRRG